MVENWEYLRCCSLQCEAALGVRVLGVGWFLQGSTRFDDPVGILSKLFRQAGNCVMRNAKFRRGGSGVLQVSATSWDRLLILKWL